MGYISKNIMLKLEEITKITKKGKEFLIIFDDGNTIHLKTRRVIIPLLMLIKYSNCTRFDLHGRRFDIVDEVIKEKSDIPLKNNYIHENKIFADLRDVEGFKFIDSEYDAMQRRHFILSPEEHSLLFKPIDESKYEISTRVNLDMRMVFCNHCYKEIKSCDAVIDYIKPIFRGGEDEQSNKQILCYDCYYKRKTICKRCVEICDRYNCPFI